MLGAAVRRCARKYYRRKKNLVEHACVYVVYSFFGSIAVSSWLACNRTALVLLALAIIMQILFLLSLFDSLLAFFAFVSSLRFLFAVS